MAYAPYKKLSKRKQREQDERKRETWGQIKPVTRKIDSAKMYNRKKARCWHQNADGAFFYRHSFYTPEPIFLRFLVGGWRVQCVFMSFYWTLPRFLT